MASTAVPTAASETAIRLPHSRSSKGTVGFIQWQLEAEWLDRIDDPIILDKFAFLQDLLSSFHGVPHYPLHVYACSGKLDRGVILTIGPWQSPNQQYKEFEHSEAMRELLVELGGFVDIRSSFHVDASMDDFPALNDPFSTFGRYWLDEGRKGEFLEEGWKPFARRYEEEARVSPVRGAWKVSGQGWKDQDFVDRSEKYAGLYRAHAQDDEENDEEEEAAEVQVETNDMTGRIKGGNTAEFVAMAGWDSEERQQSFIKEADLPVEQRRLVWAYYVKAVSMCKRVDVHWLRKLDYKFLEDGELAGDEEGKKQEAEADECAHGPDER